MLRVLANLLKDISSLSSVIDGCLYVHTDRPDLVIFRITDYMVRMCPNKALNIRTDIPEPGTIRFVIHILP